MSYAQTAFTNGYEFSEGTGYTLPEYPFVAPPELRSGKVGRHKVVVVGGGVTGLTMACALAHLGVDAVLLDEDNTVGVKGASSRGICYTQKSLEIFQKLGIYERVNAKGIQWSVGRTFAGHDEVYSFDLRQNSGYNLSAQPPFINIQQFYVEGYLVERIAELGHVDVRWLNRVTKFEQNDDFATLHVETPEGGYVIEAEHVVDATGSRSAFRRWCHSEITSYQGDDRWCIADVRFKTRPPTERHTWVEAPFNENRAVWQHLMGDDVWRIDYQMAPDADPKYVGREDVVRERLARQFGADTPVEIVWVGPYVCRTECIDTMRVGRVFFMGDSAKVVIPFGARGGNTGIADADNLAWKLAAVTRGEAAPALLDSYNEERHEAARENVRVSARTARFLRPADGIERVFRNAAIGLARQHTFARQMVNTGRMAIANPYSESSVCEPTGGLPVQNVSFGWANGKAGTVNDLLGWANGRLMLLAFGELDATDIGRLCALASQAPIVAVQVLGAKDRPQAHEHVRDPHGTLRDACHVHGHRWALVRPDSYIAATGEDIDSDVVNAITRALGASGADA